MLEAKSPDERPENDPEDQNTVHYLRVSSRGAQLVLCVVRTDIARPVEAQQM